ncbi:MAG: hypothetical protein KDA43_07135, partial [Hyphomonas sp.]|nr:hypothetical protein [Hyphomonas sp.]
MDGSCPQERCFNLACDFFRGDLFVRQPPAELADKKCLLPERDLRISASGEVVGKWLQIRRQWPFGTKPLRPLSAGPVHRKISAAQHRIHRTMPTDKSNITTERKKMIIKHGIVPKSAYDL